MSEQWMALYLSAPLQAWGVSSRFMRRTTLPHPTQSGVVGMLCAAMGIERDDESGIARLAGLDMEFFVMAPGGRLTDYHTVGGGYDAKQQRGAIPHSAGGGPFGTVLTYREYLEDARFGVLVRGEASVINECAAALRDPVWGVWFGRKACIPTDMIVQGVFGSRKEAFQCLEAKKSALSKDGKTVWRRIVGVDLFDKGNDTFNDVPLNFKTRAFKPRRVLVD